MRTIRQAALTLAAVLLLAGSAFAGTLQCSVPNSVYQAQSGSQYKSDGIGVVTAVAAVDVGPLTAAGCQQIGVRSGLIGRLLNANMNTTSDQQIPMFATKNYRVTKITVQNASVSLTTAAGGIYPAAAKAGTAIVANTQAYSSLSASTLALDLTIVSTPGLTFYPSAQAWYFALTTSQGAASTADILVYGDVGQ